jgi:NAD+ synthase
MKFNPAAFAKQAQVFLREYLEEAGIEKVVIGLSGGVDSAVAYNLAVRAIGVENVIPVMLPNGSAGTEAMRWACEVAKVFGTVPKTRDISPIVKAAAAVNGCNNPRRLGNIAARARMMVLYDIAASERAIVLGTENKTEHYLAYFTKAGDEVSDIELIRDLWKTQVWELARYIEVPSGVVEKPPTADLWNGQTDEEELGFTYKEADLILEGLIEKKLSVEELQAQDLSEKSIRRVQRRMQQTAFKLQDTPYPELSR